MIGDRTLDGLRQMNFTVALPTFLITLREGVEAALVVGIVLACLSKAGQTQLIRWVYYGIAGGITGSVLIGLALSSVLLEMRQVLPTLEAVIEPLLATLFCGVAIIMLSWMLIWMTQQARSLKAELESSVTTALTDGDAAGWSIFSLICIAVLREGFETVLFIFANFQQGSMSVLGAIAGVLGAALIGLALFKWGIRINIRRFFQTMGILLLLIVAGLVVSLCKNLDAALYATSQINLNMTDLCFSGQSCILGPLVWDASTVLPDKQFPGILLKTFLGYRDHIYFVQLVAYVLFLVTIGSTYLRSLNVLASRPNQTAPSQ